MNNNALADAFDEALNRMIDGADVELCARQCATRAETLRPLLQVAHSLFALAEEADAALFAPGPGAETLDWAALLNSAPPCSTPATVAAR